jgi:hypothetical protein
VAISAGSVNAPMTRRLPRAVKKRRKDLAYGVGRFVAQRESVTSEYSSAPACVLLRLAEVDSLKMR